MTRIRYKKTDKELVSTKPILCNNKFVNVKINLDKMTYCLIDATSNELILNGGAPDTQTIKRRIKNDLKSIGAKFFDEIRNGRKLIIEA
jgi:hypothetical protein